MFENRTVVCYGMSKNIYSYVSRLETGTHIDFFCDSDEKYVGRSPFMDGKICITPSELFHLENPLVILTVDTKKSINQIETWLNENKIENIRVWDILDRLEYEVDSSWVQTLQQKRVHKFIDLNMHGTTMCNFHCDYCYVWRRHEFENSTILSNHTVKEIRNGLSVEKTGGICFINMCARGETMLSSDIAELAYELLDEGHYVSIVTNGTVKKNIEKILEFPERLQERFFFKLSFHYLELEKRNLFDVFWKNVEAIKRSRCSYTLEITPYDGLVDRIPEIKAMFSEKTGGVMPHISYARDSKKVDYDILSDYSLEEYGRIWGQFDSKMFDLKCRHYGEKIKEYCHAGEWSYLVNILTGDIRACYRQDVIGNIYAPDFKSFPARPVGCDCHMAYCYNNHAFIAWGTVPAIKDYSYLEMRDRIDADGKHWVKEPMRSFMADKLYDTNYAYEENWSDYPKLFEADRKPAFLILNSPDYENVGDIVIAAAEKKFLHDFFPQYDVIEISCEQYQKESDKLKQAVKPDDVIVITGGGYLGSLWLRIEDYTINILQTFRSNKAIVFPQSMFFHQSNAGTVEKRKLQEIIDVHGDILIALRDKHSYETAEKMWGGKKELCLVPDMAFYLSNGAKKRNEKRQGGLLCFRNDKESLNWSDDIAELLQKGVGDIEKINGLPVKSVKLTDRDETIEAAIGYLASKELVVTDRLHCMILCALTGTPCVALDNISRKLSGTFEWIAKCGYISVVHTEEALEGAIRQVRTADSSMHGDLLPKFDGFAKEIESFLYK